MQTEYSQHHWCKDPSCNDDDLCHVCHDFNRAMENNRCNEENRIIAQHEKERLQERIRALEYEKERLQARIHVLEDQAHGG